MISMSLMQYGGCIVLRLIKVEKHTGRSHHQLEIKVRLGKSHSAEISILLHPKVENQAYLVNGLCSNSENVIQQEPCLRNLCLDSRQKIVEKG